jgi:hypothetical protein
MNIITKEDFELIKLLNSRSYSSNSMATNSTDKERELFKNLKAKLKRIAVDYKKKYDLDFGEFKAVASSGNPIKFGGDRINRVWSGFYKGAENKQYAAQISFVIDAEQKCIDMGFYFGRAASRGKGADMDRLKFLGNLLSETISNDTDLMSQYESIIDYGFQTYSSNGKVSSQEWLEEIKLNPENSQIVYRLHTNEEGYIETSTINLYVSMLMFLMGIIPSVGTNTITKKKKPLTPEERAKQAERRALIGLKGEIAVLNKEREKLNKLKIDLKHLKHVALESDSFGYDIHSCDKQKNDLFIEVKTTTRTKEDLYSNQFHMSSNEYEFYKKNKKEFRLFRVYDIESEYPIIEIVDMDSVEFTPESYVMKIIKA